MEHYIEIPNNSHYITNTSKSKYRIVNPRTFTCQQSKQLSYYIRLYYHYQYVQQLGGQCYFYTLTYNDAALPHFHGVPCFNYDDLSKFMNGGFTKVLSRKYGYKMQYFVSSELGEGKGQRGEGNNPHYHVLFFLIPNGEPKAHLTPAIFQEIVRKFWCGSDYRNKHRQDYKYGIAMPGDHLGLLQDASAISYVTKYVLKDFTYHSHVKRLKEACQSAIYDRLSTMRMAVNIYMRVRSGKYPPAQDPLVLDFVNRIYNNVYKRDVMRLHVNKVRCSQGVGLHAISNINADGVTVTLPVGNKIKTVNVPMYIYRKLYYDIVKDAADNNKYVLNDAGIAQRLKQLPKQIYCKSQEVKSIIDYYRPNNSYDDNVYRLYTTYDLVYRDRLCTCPNIPLNPIEDSTLFLTSEYYLTSYLEDVQARAQLDYYLRHNCTYKYHREFLPYEKIFDEFDKIINNHYICLDESRQHDFFEQRKVKSMLGKEKFKQYISSL